ncbi:IS30 family transposase, partial [Thiolapillus sp.]|uniref:IS30 family transposase n=1 Tax=Thiolapillus sp. TaxID=2017437 RepID=UPI0025F99D28
CITIPGYSGKKPEDDRLQGVVKIRRCFPPIPGQFCTLINTLGAVADQVATITFDNGKEFAYHKQIAEALECEVYFARPYHSWERGTNENMNGLIRQYFPKGTDFDQVTDEEIAAVERKLNMRPRKRLGYRAPIEVFCEGLHRQDAASGGVAVIG